MADISKLARMLNGVARQVDLSANTLVVDNIKMRTGSGDPTKYFTFSGSPTAVRTISVPDQDVNLAYIYNLITLTGVAAGSTDLGTFTGITIPDNVTIKAALQSLETSLEATAANNEFFDNLFRIKDNVDASKKIAFEASGIATATTRTITMPNADVNLDDVNHSILQNGSRAFTADQSFGGFKATNLSDPTSGQDAVTLAYLTARLAGVKPKAAVRAATLVAGTLASSFQNGSVIDTVTLATGDRILIKNQASAAENGIYTVNASGAPTRATDFDSTSPIDEINGAWVAIQEGSQGGQIWVQFGVVATVGTDPINFEYFNPIAGLIGGDMITFSGSTFSVDLAAASGLESTNPGNVAGQLRIKLEASNPSLKFTGSNELAAKLDPAGAITSGASGLIVGVDNSTLEISGNQIREKDAGTTAAKLNSNVFDQATITGGTGSAAVVQNAPLLKKTMVAGESFAANTSFLVRFGINSLSETSDRVYKADKDASSTDKFWCIGIALSTSSVSAGQNIAVIMLGTHTLGSSDTPFAAGDPGKAVWLTSSGAFSVTAPSAANEADFKIGIVEDTNKIWVSPQMLGVN